MSYDRALEHPCPHVLRERLDVETGRRTLRPSKPITSSGSVKVRFLGQRDIPHDGLRVQATLAGTIRGPFSITPLADTLSLSVDGAARQSVTLDAAVRLRPIEIATHLNRQLKDVTFHVTKQGTLRLTSHKSGRFASLFVDPSPLATLLGLPTGVYRTGHDTLPGWTLVRDAQTLDDRPTQLVIFDEQIRAHSPFFEIEYATAQPSCPRCGGLGIEHDFRVTDSGDYQVLRGRPLLVQECLKAILTVRGSNPFHAWYGSRISDSIGTKFTGGFFTSRVESEVRESLTKLQSLKKRQEELGQPVSDTEVIAQVLNVSVTEDERYLTTAFISVEIMSRDGARVSLERGLTP
jgi:hypothetical protein